MMKKGEKKYDLMLRLTNDGKRKFKTLKSGITIKNWDLKHQKLKGVKPSKEERYQQYLKYKKFVDDIEKKYIKQINDLLLLKKPFSMDKVLQLVEKPPQVNTTVFEVFVEWIDTMNKAEKYGSRDVAKGTLNKFKSFHKNDLMFNELDDLLLLKYKQYLLKDGLAPTSVSIHLRAFRALYNIAIHKKIASLDDYPFRNKEIMSGLKTGRKSRALQKSDVDAIRLHLKILDVDTIKWHACNYFIFGYVGRGINFSDIARLKWENYKHGKITFIRHKTRSKIQEETRFAITDELKVMLDHYKQLWRNKKQLDNPYIFPILNGFHNTEERKHNRIIKLRKMVNSELKEVGEKLEFPVKTTTYVWRHTFATVAKNELNVSIPMISEMLGHHDLGTTEAYLKQFEDIDKDKAVIGL